MTIISKIPLLLEMKLFLLLLRSINLECPIHAGAGKVLGVFTKPHSGSHSSVVVHYLKENTKILIFLSSTEPSAHSTVYRGRL